MESLLQSISGVGHVLGDILISGGTKEEHLAAVDEVLNCLNKAGLWVKYRIFEFLRSSVSSEELLRQNAMLKSSLQLPCYFRTLNHLGFP